MCGRRPIRDLQNKKPATDFSVRVHDFRDDGVMPVICPTCQTVFWRSTLPGNSTKRLRRIETALTDCFIKQKSPRRFPVRAATSAMVSICA
jgi:hypothetical protein